MALLSIYDTYRYIAAEQQENLDKTREVVATICKLKKSQEKLALLLKQNPTSTSSSSNTSTKKHDEAISTAVVVTLSWATQMKETKCYCKGRSLITDLVCAAWRRI